MAEVHNTLIRGLNAIIQQAPYVKRASTTESDNTSLPASGACEKDVEDFLAYVENWVVMVNHHHDVEEAFLFPELGKFTGVPGYMDDPIHQHTLFHDGLVQLLAYARDTPPGAYRWEGPGGAGGMKEIVDGFSKALTEHLYAEIDVLLGMKAFDSEGLRKTFEQGDDAAKKHGNLGEILTKVFPCVLGCHDKTYVQGSTFPPFPWVLTLVVKYWFAAGNGAWRFNPCDLSGRPRPLAFGPR